MKPQEMRREREGLPGGMLKLKAVYHIVEMVDESALLKH